MRGTHEELGRAMGEFRAAQLKRSTDLAKAALWEADVSRAMLAEQIGPYVEATERIFPQHMRELRAMAEGAQVPFDVLFRLNCYESRPPGTPPGSVAGPAGPSPVFATLPTRRVEVKDPGVLAGAAPAGDGCTSVVSRGDGTVIVGHTEDSSPEAVDGIYLLDAEVVDGGNVVSRFLALNYANTIPGCAAAMNRHGLIVLIDALPDPDRRLGASRHVVSRALLDCESIDAAIGLLRETERGGGWNYVLIQGDRFANVETTATRVVVTEDDGSGAYAHANHYLNEEIAADAGDPRPNSVARLMRAQQLVDRGLSLEAIKQVLSDREGFPDSICRERTIAAFVADAAAKRVEVCWGEPEGASWTAYSLGA
ncbi:MAG TPA: C45 family peptidase [Chloroflexota bacterium]|nr:C45 family peptidase [Chloroflexota bacterium]